MNRSQGRGLISTSSIALVMLTAANARAASSCSSSTPLPDHTAADLVREISNVVYAPFANYSFPDGGLCIDPAPLQTFVNVYVRSPDGISPQIESLCLDRPDDGHLELRWTLGPTPEAALLVASGENEEIVRSHDFWHVGIPQSMCSKKMKLDELIFERDGGLDIFVRGNNAEIDVHGLSLSADIQGTPSFLTHDIGIDAFFVDENNVFTAKLSAPLFDIPVGAVGDIGPDDPLSLDIFGFRFRVKK